MLQFTIDTDGKVIGITNLADRNMKEIYLDGDKACGIRVVNRNDFDSFEDAQIIAYEANLWGGVDGFGDPLRFVPVDHGNAVSPRYDVIREPQIGDPVSRAFNGDSYPCGYITKISKSLRRIETDEGDVFYARMIDRTRLTGTWRGARKSPFCLVHGHVDKRNPSF